MKAYTIFGIVLFFVLAGCAGQQEQANSTSESAGQTKKPNIIFIMADDLGYGDIEPFGQTRIKTPNLDQMATEGMRFTQHYSGSTVCAPSRSVLMTGLHTGHTPVRGNMEHMPIGQYPMPYSVPTFAEVLSEAGYATGAFGKWGLGYPGSEGSPANQGFDLFFGYNGQRRAHFYYPEFLFRETREGGPERVQLDGNEVENTSREGFEHPGSGPPITRGTYSQDAIMEEALAFIDEQAGQENPFFAYLPLNIPHASLTVPERALEPYLDENGQSMFEEEPFGGGHYTAQSRPNATYAAMVTLLDQYVGELFQKLRDRGVAENTLVIFTSDNGPHLEGGYDPEFFNSNGPLRGAKRDLYEGGIRVPTIVWWPGTVQAGATSDHISAFEDWMPTFAELTGNQAPPNIDGVSMVPELTGQGTQPKRNHLYWEFPARGGKQAVRQGDWKAIRLGINENADAPLELYNLAEDPGEQQDVAADNPEVVEQMRSLMEQSHIRSELFPLLESERK